MTKWENHLHQMVTGLLELLLPSTATLDTQDLDQAQEHARILETGTAKTQHAI